MGEAVLTGIIGVRYMKPFLHTTMGEAVLTGQYRR